MDKFISRIVAIALLGLWCSLVYPGDFNTQYRGMGVQSSDSAWGDLIFFVIFVVCTETGKYLEKHPMGDYTCPSYCDVDHKHIRRIDEKPTPAEEKPNQEGDPGVYGPVVLADGK